MNIWNKSINIALSPNNTWKDTLLALGEIFLPWNWFSWQSGRAREELVEKFGQWLGGSGEVLAMGSGREALYLILKSLNLQAGDEIILQSFTCMVVVNSIVWAGLKPVFVDADETFNINPQQLVSQITPRTKAVLIQHTFGIPAATEKIKKICQTRNLILIEDCAHALGAEDQGRKVGTFGDLSFFSLGRSKVISCVNGGLIVCNNKKFLANLKQQYANTREVKRSLIFQNLWHPWIATKAKFFYNFFNLGKVIMVLSQKMKLVSFEVTKAEKAGIKPANFPTKLPNALAKLALVQLKLLRDFNEKRKSIANYYYQNLKNIDSLKLINPADFPGAIFLRYPLLCPDPSRILKAAKKEGIILGDWYNVPIAPPDINKEKSCYTEGSNPFTEKLSKQVINLPTYHALKETDLKKIINIIKNAES